MRLVASVAVPTRGRAAAVLGAVALLPFVGEWERTAGAATPVRVAVDPTPRMQPVGRRFIGLSFEAAALPAVARSSKRGNLVALLRSLGRGVLRFGGFTADTSTAFAAHGEAPAWATTTITPRDFARLRTLARRTGWRLLLTLPLGRYDPRAAAGEAAAAARRLGPALAAFEIGNEPNAFWILGARPQSYSYEQYRGEIRSYRRAIAVAAPGVPIAGPDIVPQLGGFEWLRAYARDERPALLTPHYYALNACTQSDLTVADLFSASVAMTEALTMSAFAAVARAQALPMRIGETNNVACAGKAGVSDTFGAALWALRYMLTIARLGIDGVNFHALPETCSGYSPICARTRTDHRRGRLRVMPEWYALLLFRQLVGAHPAGTSLSGHPPGLTVEALRAVRAEGVEVVAVNTAADVDVSLVIRLAGRGEFRSGTVIPLTAPALEATAGVRLGGGRVSRRGTWLPGRPPPRVSPSAGAIRVYVPGASAALIRLER